MNKLSMTIGLVGLMAVCLTLMECVQTTPAEVTLNVDYASAPKHLSEYHFFKGQMKDLTPNNRVMPYDLITPLFTDYAHKARFVWMPEGVSAGYSRDEALDFPVGTVLIKNFYYPFDFSHPDKGRRIIETRLLVHKKDKWDALTYVWNKDQTDADLNIIGATTGVDWVDLKGIKMHDEYSVPNKNQCKSCHSYNGNFTPIGPKVRNLNRDYAFADGTMNQLDKWVESGYLTGYEKAANMDNKVAKWDDSSSGTLEQRARAYLDVNCAHCHRKEGTGNPSGLYLTLSTTNPSSLGILKTPEAAGRGAGNYLYDIIPGKPDESIMPHRISITEPGQMMPQIGRKLVHWEGVDLIKKWIASMPSKP